MLQGNEQVPQQEPCWNLSDCQDTLGIQAFGRGDADEQVGYGKWLQVGVMEAAGCLESGI